MSNLKPIRKIIDELNRLVVGGAKVLHGMSHPVIRKTADKHYAIAIFVLTYSKTDLDNELLPRPSKWILADVTTGEVIQENLCSALDFSEQSFEKMYSSKILHESPITRAYYDNMYNIFDTIRTVLFDTGSLDPKLYQEYMELLLKIIPQEYQIFYTELSNPV